MTESIDGKGNVTRYTYDIMGNVTRIENAEENSQSYEYNASGKVTKVTDFDGESIRREYNVLNRPSKVIDKEGRETLLTYDSMWNLARITEPNGAKTTYIYNQENLLEESNMQTALWYAIPTMPMETGYRKKMKTEGRQASDMTLLEG